jgi:rare lipoprotein A (peptidoglycan hydrolase)
MLFFGLAWAASWISSFFVVDKAEAYLARTNPIEPPPEESALYASSQPQALVSSTSESGSVHNSEPVLKRLSSSLITGRSLASHSVADRGVASFFRPPSGDNDSHDNSHDIANNANNNAGPTSSLASTWMGSQGYVLELTQPLTRWLTALNPLQFISTEPLYLGQVSGEAISGPMNFGCVGQRGMEQSTGQPTATNGAIGGAVGHSKFGTLQVWVEQCLLSEVSDRSLRDPLAKQIVQVLGDGEWRGDQIYPTLVGNQPAVRIGNQVVFVVTPDLAGSLGKNNEVVATEWGNQLRVMLGAKPFNLVDSQTFMHGLEASGQFIEGEASWYGPYFHGRQTATGEIYDMGLFTAAHQTLPLDSYLKVTNVDNGRSLIVRVNDRGPYVDDRIIDLSHGAAQYLGTEDKGVVNVKAEILRPAINPEVEIRPHPTLRLEDSGETASTEPANTELSSTGTQTSRETAPAEAVPMQTVSQRL